MFIFFQAIVKGMARVLNPAAVPDQHLRQQHDRLPVSAF
jgi:hypothetical protein